MVRRDRVRQRAPSGPGVPAAQLVGGRQHGRRGRRWLAALQLALALSLAGSLARADDIDDLLEARDLYVGGEYRRATDALRPLANLDTENPRQASIATTARKYLAACLYAQHQEPQARAVLVRMLHDDPDALLDQEHFDANFLLLFEGLRDEMRVELTHVREDRLRARQEAEASRLAREEIARRLITTEEHFEDVPRVLTFLPFGVGQFANGQRGFGVFFLVTEAVLLASNVTAFAWYESIRPAGNAIPLYTGRQEDVARAQLAQGLFVVNVASLSSLVAVMVGGVLQANLAWQPRRHTTAPRPMPPELQNFRLVAAPWGDATGAGAMLRLTF